MIIQGMNPSTEGICTLSHLGVIRASGPDAAKFLHSQLTQDFLLIRPHEARLAAYCSPKGRVLASFFGVQRAADEFLLVCHQTVLAATLKRLKMFVLRAKLTLEDVSSALLVCGRVYPQDSTRGAAAWTREADGDWLWINLPDAAGRHRALGLAPAGTPSPPLPALPLATWLQLEVLSGVATVQAELVDALVPQMLNYESVGGVNFKKGCYPGQEVVARSQFRGTLKRRTFLVRCEQSLKPGDEVFSAGDNVADPQACGLVVQTACVTEGQHLALVAMQIAAAEAGPVSVHSPAGPVLTLLDLPYVLLDDV